MVNTKQILKTIEENPDGVTIDLNGTKPSLKGYMVSITDNAISELTENEVNKLVAQIESLTTDGFIGSWLDRETKKLYLDVSLNVAKRSEALTIARLFKQKAIFDLNKLDEIRL